MQILQESSARQFDKDEIGMEQETSIETNEQLLTDEAIIAKINELHAQAEQYALSAKDLAGKAVECAIKCGEILLQKKKALGHGNWLKWRKANLRFSDDTAERYMTLWRKTKELSSQSDSQEKSDGSNSAYVRNLEARKAKTLRQAYIATGILPEPQKPDPEDKIEPLVIHVKHIDFVVKWYRDTVENKPAKDWKFIEREALINDLKPLMEIYNELVELQENCNQ